MVQENPHGSVQIRLATPDDAPAMAHISVLGWRYAYTQILPVEYLDQLDEAKRAERMRERLASMSGPAQFALVAEDENRNPIGFVECSPQTTGDDDVEMELQTFYVHPDAHGRGIGRLLMIEAVRRMVEAGFRSMIIWTFANNAATGFYERMGGVVGRTSLYEVGGQLYPDVGYVWRDLPSWLKQQGG